MFGLLPNRVLLQPLFIIPTELNASYCVWLHQSCKLKHEGFHLFIYLYLYIYLLYKCTWYMTPQSTWRHDTCMHFNNIRIIKWIYLFIFDLI